MKSLLLDIEGTTTPIDFVHKVLFPFARKRIEKYLSDNFAELAPEREQLEIEARADVLSGAYRDEFLLGSPRSVTSYLHFLIDNDRKSTPLKSIQGQIWKSGYESGDLKSIVYDDVPPAFARLKKKGIPINIYSSGSVLAQVLLFRHSDHGDLTDSIAGYYDTNIGTKRDTNSYRKIARQSNLGPSAFLFVSDVDAELDAAARAGMSTLLSVRNGNPPQENERGHKEITSFEDL